MDTVTRKRRSYVMSCVRSKNSVPELAVRRLLHRLGFRFRLHQTNLPGTPDIVLTRHRVVVFVHGCFWHRHPGCPNTRTPKSRVTFWRKKFEANIERDRIARSRLRRAGWRVLVVWECQSKKSGLASRVKRFMER
ncbi:MAG: DNA mismatch endonuclease Vsr [Planctomycetota bacterium]|nr:DNA mismatch endonuclease Vsr [Planctomycetota bacterium]